MITGNEPAQPQIQTKERSSYGGKPWGDVSSSGGLTIRQHFAAQFYAARITGLTLGESKYSKVRVAELACEDADTLIAELNKEKP